MSYFHHVICLQKTNYHNYTSLWCQIHTAEFDYQQQKYMAHPNYLEMIESLNNKSIYQTSIETVRTNGVERGLIRVSIYEPILNIIQELKEGLSDKL